ncbi:MazG-like family protein [Kitasatospora sp. NPDC057223]|uniref:MazG-like family protein n=1 Tax=Kitasatospora sp. NPDC057223 TaxID=3346055 RepID=UPI0036338B78
MTEYIRALAQDAARSEARRMLASLIPGQTGINLADEVADAVLGAAQSYQQAGTFAIIRHLVDWLDQANGTGETETARRLLKLTEEVGEVSSAYIGTVGQNPRKGVTHTNDDVADELCDVIVTAMVALHRFTDNPGQHFAAKVQHIADRVLVKEQP